MCLIALNAERLSGCVVVGAERGGQCMRLVCSFVHRAAQKRFRDSEQDQVGLPDWLGKSGPIWQHCSQNKFGVLCFGQSLPISSITLMCFSRRVDPSVRSKDEGELMPPLLICTYRVSCC